MVDYIKTLSTGTERVSSPAQALQLAAEQLNNSHRANTTKLIILAHDGISADLIAQALEARLIFHFNETISEKLAIN